ncbi:MAG: hypothetical protein AB1921_17505 [Thermodesulfobacteriota bacterium]
MQDRDPEMKIKLTGWKAVVAILVLLGLLGWRYAESRRTLGTEAADVVRHWLVAEYTRNNLATWTPEERSFDNKEEAAQKAQELLAASRVTILSIQARGSGDDVVVRVEVQVDGKTPPDGRSVRYFRMSHSALIGWQMRYDAGPWAWYLKLL